ncbi:flagellar basal body-associated protein FliL [Corallincola platygyrae]|uniref:Flagellar protein FliL n=1 Tax=Corallincola platygyrae TaxID=1193278 RepID=A0ABW4XQS0_9GAMM
MKFRHLIVAICMSMVFGLTSKAAQAEGGNFMYYGFEPDIITNYISTGKKLGFVRVTIELMVEGENNLKIMEHHAPLLRAALVDVLGRQPEERVKSLAGREEIRKLCFTTVNQLLKKETGQELAAELLFTKYIYH